MITTIRLPDELHRKLKVLAGERGLTFNAMVIVVLMEFVDSVFGGRE